MTDILRHFSRTYVLVLAADDSIWTFFLDFILTTSWEVFGPYVICLPFFSASASSHSGWGVFHLHRVGRSNCTCRAWETLRGPSGTPVVADGSSADPALDPPLHLPLPLFLRRGSSSGSQSSNLAPPTLHHSKFSCSRSPHSWGCCGESPWERA